MTNNAGKLPVRLKLAPGQKGTKKLTSKYGDNLVCVRYRYDASEHKRHTTVEIIETTVDWEPKSGGSPKTPASNDRLGIKIRYEEEALTAQVKQVGGIWRPRQRLWELPYAQICALGLQARIADGE